MNHQWKGLKCLPLSPWMTSGPGFEPAVRDCQPFTPFIGRNGRYAMRAPGRYIGWFEVDGRAWVDDMFEYDYQRLERQRLTLDQLAAAKLLAMTAGGRLRDVALMAWWEEKEFRSEQRPYMRLKKRLRALKAKAQKLREAK
jgi:hypothetical protein